jgi:uncharacterized membrane protein
VITVLEYAVGYLSEKIFKLKLWDYSEKRFNLHGYVCLRFSLIWTLLATGFVLFVHPEALRRVALLPEGLVQIAAIAFMVYFWIDYTFSVISLAAFRKASPTFTRSTST